MSIVCGSSSLNTPHSRTRRAISWEYWPPKSRTRTSSARTAPPSAEAPRGCASAPVIALVAPAYQRRFGVADAAAVVGDRRGRGRPRGAHADGLLALEVLALALERGRHHDLGPVERGDVLVPARRHRGAQRAHQVEGAVVLVSGAEQDLLDRPVLRRLDARAARQRRMERGHAPVEAAAGRLVGARER